MSSGKYGLADGPFMVAGAAVALLAAGGAKALEEGNKAAEAAKLMRQEKRCMQMRLAAEKQHAAEMNEEANTRLIMRAAQLEQQLEVQGYRFPPAKDNETAYERIVSLLRLKSNLDAQAITVTSGSTAEDIFADITAVCTVLLANDWQNRQEAEQLFRECRRIFEQNGNCKEALWQKYMQLAEKRQQWMKEIQAVDALRSQYLNELASARTLYAVQKKSILVSDFDYRRADEQIRSLQKLNDAQRKLLDAIYEDPSHGMTTEQRVLAMEQAAAKIAAVMAAKGNTFIGADIQKARRTDYFTFGNALIRSSVAENGMVLMEVVGNAEQPADEACILAEMERFKNSFEEYRAAMREAGLNYRRTEDIPVCPESVTYANPVRGIMRNELSHAVSDNPMERALNTHEEV